MAKKPGAGAPPVEPQATQEPAPVIGGGVPVPAVSKKKKASKRKASKKKKTTSPASPASPSPAASPAVASAAVVNVGPNGDRRHHKYDWAKTPIALFVGDSSVVRAAFGNPEEAMAYIKTLKPQQRERVALGRVVPVQVQVNVTCEL